MRRSAMRRRRCTAQIKELPVPEVIQARMADIQKKIEDGNYQSSQVLSGDETAMLFGLPPKNQYIPESAERAVTPAADEKARFTTFIFGSAEGLSPCFSIVECQAKNGYDLSNSKVIHSLHHESFTAAEGWALMMWERTLALPSRQRGAPPELTRCRRPFFLVHSVQHVITCHNKAWMDATGTAMLCDVLIGWASVCGCWRRTDGLGQLRCKVHAVRAVYDSWNINTCELPPRCTSELQVMDLVVNRPLKAAIRRHRTQELFNYCQGWK